MTSSTPSTRPTASNSARLVGVRHGVCALTLRQLHHGNALVVGEPTVIGEDIGDGPR